MMNRQALHTTDREGWDDRLDYWADEARYLDWSQPWNQILDWSSAPFARWFVGGRLNVAYNCVDRHVEAGYGDQVAFHWEGEPGDTRTITYNDLRDEVCRAANALLALGVAAGDRVAIYMPMIPEAVFAMLACARVGAPHTVVFGGFSATALADRIQDSQATVVLTADGGYRRGEPSALKPAVDEALATCPNVRSVVVVKRTGQEVQWVEGRDSWWHELVGRQAPRHRVEWFDSEHPLFIMYTSGTTGRPKGILHTSGGYLTQAASSHRTVFDLDPQNDVYWCGADIGWITGHSYMVYGPLANRTTSVLYEGVPNSPDESRWWRIIEKYGVTILYTAPTTIRMFMRWGEELPAAHDLSTLRVLGSVGEPINPAAWEWYSRVIGSGRCPIVDTWWQTETGAVMISPLPDDRSEKAGSAYAAMPGVSVEVVDEAGNSLEERSGLLVVTEPWPSMARGIWGDRERFIETYWSKFGSRGYYFAGDGARRDEDGHIWLLGRVDDVINVSGHRLSTSEVEAALSSHSAVTESAVVGVPDPTTGQALVAFVISQGDARELSTALRAHVATEIGPIAKPRDVVVVPDLPKTRSGKIMRRLLRDIADHQEIGDTTTLTDPGIVELIKGQLASPPLDRSPAP